MHSQDIRRRHDGSLDIDFYRQRGLVERRQVMTGFFKGMGKLGRPLLAAAVFAVAIYAAPSGEGKGWHRAGADSSAASSAGLIDQSSMLR